MRRTVSLLSSVVIGLGIAVLGGPHVAHAQAVEDFNPGANQTVWTVAVQPDGKTVFGGVFTGLGGGTGATARNHIGRLNVDGTVDMSFNSAQTPTSTPWRCSRMGRSWSAATSRRSALEPAS